MVQNACHSGDSSALSTGVGFCSGFCLPRSGGISLPGGASPRVGAVGSEPPILLTRTPNGGDSSTRAGPGVDCDQAPLGNTMRSVAGAALIAPARGRASKKTSTNIVHTSAARCFWKPKWPWVRTKPPKPAKPSTTGRAVCNARFLLREVHVSGASYPARAPKGAQIANPRPTPKPGNLGPPWPPGTSGDPAGYSRAPPPRGLKIIVGSFGIPLGLTPPGYELAPEYRGWTRLLHEREMKADSMPERLLIGPGSPPSLRPRLP